MTGLGKRYGRTWALRDCSIRIPAGRIAGLVGPNGAGKTTFLNLAACLLRPSAGEVCVFGRSPFGHPGLLLDRIGYVAQDAPLYSGFSVADMLQSLELAGRPPLLFHLTATETAPATWSGPDPLHEALQLAPRSIQCDLETGRTSCTARSASSLPAARAQRRAQRQQGLQAEDSARHSAR